MLPQERWKKRTRASMPSTAPLKPRRRTMVTAHLLFFGFTGAALMFSASPASAQERVTC
jgi:hypothetical protein